MTVRNSLTARLLKRGVGVAWRMAREARRLGDAGERLETRLEALAAAQGIDMQDVLEPLLPQRA